MPFAYCGMQAVNIMVLQLTGVRIYTVPDKAHVYNVTSSS